MSKPIVLPQDFMEEWTSEPSRLNPSTVKIDPFSDSRAMSRVTASGFTDTTLAPDLRMAELSLMEAIEDSKKQSRFFKKSNESELRPEEMGQREGGKGYQPQVDDQIRNMACQTDLDGRVLSGVDDNRLPVDQTRHQGNVRHQGGTSQLPRYQGDDTGPIDSSQVEKAWQQEAQEKYVTLADFTEFAKTIQRAMSLHPSDSASQLPKHPDRYDHKAFNRLNLTSSKLSGIQEMESDIEGTVIGGFDMTPEEKVREVDSYVNINPVRGLAKIFLNDRLNFLSHIHSALFQLLTDDEGVYPTTKCLEILLESRKTWSQDPSTLLLETVMDATIDSRTGIVKSNPFRLPIIEPTMQLTPKIMYMALDQLHGEFETEWFNTMKTLTTPRFQSKYDKYRYRPKRDRRISSSSEQRHSSSSGSKSSRRSSSGDSQSVISAFLGR